MPRSARTYAKPQMTAPKAERALRSLLWGCRVEMLAGFTVAGLVAAYKVTPATAERLLAEAKAGRL